MDIGSDEGSGCGRVGRAQRGTRLRAGPGEFRGAGEVGDPAAAAAELVDVLLVGIPVSNGTELTPRVLHRSKVPGVWALKLQLGKPTGAGDTADGDDLAKTRRPDGVAKIKAEIEGQLPSGRCAIEDKTGDKGERRLRSVGDSPSDIGTRSQGWDKNVERTPTTCNERSHEASCSLWIRPCLRLNAGADVVRLNAATNLGTPRVGRTTRR